MSQIGKAHEGYGQGRQRKISSRGDKNKLLNKMMVNIFIIFYILSS